ncbi:MAG: hypothetical protein ACT4TC_20165 [Myxococcaceae bacterium]
MEQPLEAPRSQGKASRYVGTFLFTSALTCMIGFWWARTTGSDTFMFWAHGLKWSLIALVACALYMAGVGIYHTLLAALGLDGEPGIFSSGGRSGPFSGPPADYRAPRVVPGAGVLGEDRAGSDTVSETTTAP